MESPKKLRATPSFSLIELLAVCLIVAVLIALLVPALAGAKESARTVQCGNNLRQLFIGLALYGQDRGRYPWVYEDAGGVFEKKSNWAYRLNPYLGRGTNDVFPAGDNSRSPCIVCPSHGKQFTVPSDIKLNYAMNEQLAGEEFTDPFYPRVYPYEIRAAELILLADAAQAGSNNSNEGLSGHPEWRQPYDPATAETAIPPYNDSDLTGGTAGTVAFRHRSRSSANFLFIDGHVELVKRDQFKEKHLKLDAPIHP